MTGRYILTLAAGDFLAPGLTSGWFCFSEFFLNASSHVLVHRFALICTPLNWMTCCGLLTSVFASILHPSPVTSFPPMLYILGTSQVMLSPHPYCPGRNSVSRYKVLILEPNMWSQWGKTCSPLHSCSVQDSKTTTTNKEWPTLWKSWESTKCSHILTLRPLMPYIKAIAQSPWHQSLVLFPEMQMTNIRIYGGQEQPVSLPVLIFS